MTGFRKCQQVQLPDGSWKCMRCGKSTMKKMTLSCLVSDNDKTVKKNMRSLANRYYKERKAWIEAGKPYRDKEEMERVYNICQECPFFQRSNIRHGGKCGLCGCLLSAKGYKMNKIAWATTSCPDEPRRWEASKNPQKIDIEHDESSHDFLEDSHRDDLKSNIWRRKRGRCCGG